MKTTTRILAVGVTGLLTAGLATTLFASSASATGARYTGSPAGTVAITPEAGTNQSAINYTTSGPCPSGDSFYTLLFGAGMPDAGEVVTTKTSAGFSTSGPVASAFQNTPQYYADKNSAALSGAYDVVVRCTNGLSNTSLADFRSTITFSSATAYTASSGSPSPAPSGSSAPGNCLNPNVTTSTPIVNATGLASVTVRGAQPGSPIELQGYSQNHQGTANFDNDPTNPDRTATADSNGAATFNDLRPPSNTRLRARMAGCPTYGASAVINVRATETLAVTRTGTRTYVISGNSIPARPGGLIVSLYRINGAACAAGVDPRNCPSEVQIGQGRADQSSGKYSIRVLFPATDANKTVRLVVKTGQDAQNAPGRSNVRSLGVS